MKAILLSLFIFTAGSFAANAQTKTAEATMDTAPGYGKYMDVQPLTLTPSKKSKKLELQKSQYRVEPASEKVERESLASNRKNKRSRVEGRLASQQAASASAE